jgi:hypothetical protein
MVACRRGSSKYAGTVITALRTGPSLRSASALSDFRMIDEITSGGSISPWIFLR